MLVNPLARSVFPTGEEERGMEGCPGEGSALSLGSLYFPGWFSCSVSSSLLKPALSLCRNVISGGETKLGLTDFGVDGAAKIAVKGNLARMPGSHETRRVIGSQS